MKRQGYLADAIVTDRLRSYGAGLRDLALTDRHVTGGWSNNRVEVSHEPAGLQPLSVASASSFLSPHDPSR